MTAIFAIFFAINTIEIVKKRDYNKNVIKYHGERENIMKLGAQLFSVRNHLTTAEDMRDLFLKMKEIGYQNVQLSGHKVHDAELIKEISRESGLPIVITHTDPNRILNETEAVIAEHKLFDCPVVGIGSMPKEYRETPEGARQFVETFTPAIEKIEAAGLKIAYHNHAFELTTPYDEKRNVYDYLIDTCKTWLFTADVYWIKKGGYDIETYLRKIGGERLVNVHFKDMADNEEQSICACGDGVIDFEKLTRVCETLGVVNVLVEQDNANKFESGDIEQMRRSFMHLRPIIPMDI